MARPPGNPYIARYHFTTDRDKPLVAKLSLRITRSMLSEIQSRDNWQEFVRNAIAFALQESKLTDKKSEQ